MKKIKILSFFKSFFKKKQKEDEVLLKHLSKKYAFRQKDQDIYMNLQ